MPQPVRIGVLALQGSFAEHVSILQQLKGVEAFEVRTKDELKTADGLIIPGGESTTMALIAERWGLIPELRRFAAEQRPVWGTCAGAIFLAEKATGHLLLDRCLFKQLAALQPATKTASNMPGKLSTSITYSGKCLQAQRRGDKLSWEA